MVEQACIPYLHSYILYERGRCASLPTGSLPCRTRTRRKGLYLCARAGCLVHAGDDHGFVFPQGPRGAHAGAEAVSLPVRAADPPTPSACNAPPATSSPTRG